MIPIDGVSHHYLAPDEAVAYFRDLLGGYRCIEAEFAKYRSLTTGY